MPQLSLYNQKKSGKTFLKICFLPNFRLTGQLTDQIFSSKVTLRLAIIFVTAASVLLFMTLINKIDKIVI